MFSSVILNHNSLFSIIALFGFQCKHLRLLKAMFLLNFQVEQRREERRQKELELAEKEKAAERLKHERERRSEELKRERERLKELERIEEEEMLERERLEASNREEEEQRLEEERLKIAQVNRNSVQFELSCECDL